MHQALARTVCSSLGFLAGLVATGCDTPRQPPGQPDEIVLDYSYGARRASGTLTITPTTIALVATSWDRATTSKADGALTAEAWRKIGLALDHAHLLAPPPRTPPPACGGAPSYRLVLRWKNGYQRTDDSHGMELCRPGGVIDPLGFLQAATAYLPSAALEPAPATP